MITLYYAPRTRAVRVRWLLEELDLPYTLRRVAFVPPQRFFSQATPLGKLPVIEDGDVTIGKAGAIVEYVVEHQPPRAEPGLERTGPPGRHPDRCGVLGRLAYRVRLDAPAIDGWGSLPPTRRSRQGLRAPIRPRPLAGLRRTTSRNPTDSSAGRCSEALALVAQPQMVRRK